ncbi:2-(1,2-epoxy-1,2-dihydrophenyl)acetyl-CoA isomerase [Thermosyntropha lipolytica DSM 11003]|uniref:2-(1,2-epoxy-1,2-dihydrophenyl)acetyl-CoA isomerase n=1 Tax=Thermosyntropha lipolytica DSM 11003 TaxID=1123382 RepID=A0A1M5N259_9FIRM|nr:enoyl-CoA hydratase/isomerase family protein [Thermosyntropha lipolytica]SHG83644.1 2-(1,2-epoxy-1,2-dihydrophenyl)acetyl-CoA isomerase [Thermosyntropha lipolytica DSM 11003]
MAYNWKTVKLEVKENGIGIMTFNRPEALNAFNYELVTEVPEACKAVRENDDIQVLIITGAGPGWSAGGDISILAAMDTPQKAKATYDASTGLVQAIYEIEKPVIAAVNGPVAGAGIAAMFSCDIIIAADTAKFGFNFINIGFTPDSGASYFLVQKVGYHKALEILWYGKIMDSAEAEKLGLVNLVVPADQVLAEAEKWAERLIRKPLYTVWMDKKLLRAALKNDFYAQAELESLNQILAWASDDFKEGTRAFVEKRRPNFTGKILWRK